jgi:hypothetical protein
MTTYIINGRSRKNRIKINIRQSTQDRKSFTNTSLGAQMRGPHR